MVRIRHGTWMDPSSMQKRIHNVNLEESQGDNLLANIASHMSLAAFQSRQKESFGLQNDTASRETGVSHLKRIDR
jgi:hypothetical protein